MLDDWQYEKEKALEVTNLTPSAPKQEPTKKIYPNLDENTNYKINQIILCKENLLNERTERLKYKKRYSKLSKCLLGLEWIMISGEIALTGATIAFPLISPITVPVICLGLTITTASIRTGIKAIQDKIVKHGSVELVAKSKLDSIEKKYVQSIEDGTITSEEFETIVDEVSNYNKLKDEIINGGDTKKYELTQAIQNSLKDQGKEELRKEIKLRLNI
jgi:hypothetical protein